MKDHRCRGCGFVLLPYVKGYCRVCAPPELPRLWSLENLRALWDDFKSWALEMLFWLLALLALASVFWPYGSFSDPW